MSVQELFDDQDKLEEILRRHSQHPQAWAIRANPVWGSAETVNLIAIFDTEEAAQAYWDASLLPKNLKPEECKTPDGIYRSFRPDSLLWDYNPHCFMGSEPVAPADPAFPYRPQGVQVNPAPPSGQIPEVDGMKLNKGRYGRDFDQGRGGPYTDMSGAKPETGHVESPERIEP